MLLIYVELCSVLCGSKPPSFCHLPPVLSRVWALAMQQISRTNPASTAAVAGLVGLASGGGGGCSIEPPKSGGGGGGKGLN